MTTYNITFSSIEELEKKLKTGNYEDSERLLIQVFSAQEDRDFIKQLQKIFKENLPKSVLIGTTTDGVIDKEKVYTQGVSVVGLTYFKETLLRSCFIRSQEYGDNSMEIGYALMKEVCTPETQAVIAFSDGLHMNGEEFINGCSKYDGGILIAGGMAGDGGKLIETFVFDKEQMTNKGAVGVSLSSKNLFVTNYYSFDWLPVGKKMKVTKAHKNRVYEIDNEKIVDIYAKYLGKNCAEKLPKIGIEFPLVFEKDGVLVGRAVLAKHSDGSLTFAGNIEEGTIVRFGVGNIGVILRNRPYHMKRFLGRLKREAEAIFVYSCMARRRFFEESIEHELSMLERVGQVSGFFTYGEFYHNQNKNQFLNETMTILALSESSKKHEINLKTFEKFENEIEITAEQALAYLANKISDELSEFNEKLQEKIEEKTKLIYKQAYFDRLTGLPNRLSLINDITSKVGSTLFLINIDDFSSINDFFGDATGDLILKQLSEILKRNIEEQNRVYKLPSDEFAVIVPSKLSKTAIEEFAKKIISHIEEQQFAVGDNQKIYIGVTVAAACINQKGSGLRNANMALNLAREKNKKFMFFQEELRLAKQYEENMQKVQLIKESLKEGGVIPYFQPIVDIKTEKILKYEALIRLRSSKGEIYSPAYFLETSEKLKFYHIMMRQMIEKTFTTAKKRNIHVSINLSYNDLIDEEFQEYLFDMIKKYKIGKNLTVEILETQAIDYEKHVHDFVKKMHNTGAKIAIDDFGSGYANFKHIIHIECDYLKIDGSLIKELDTDREARLMVETIIIFAKKLGKKTVAEFVHSEKIFKIVKELGIDYAQGYYLGIPTPLE